MSIIKVASTRMAKEAIQKMRSDGGNAAAVYNMAYRGKQSFRLRTRTGKPTEIVLNPRCYLPGEPLSVYSEARFLGMVLAENAGYRPKRLNDFTALMEYHMELAKLGAFIPDIGTTVKDDTIFLIFCAMTFLRLVAAYNIMENKYGFDIAQGYQHMNHFADPSDYARHEIARMKGFFADDEMYHVLKQSTFLIRQAISPVLMSLIENYLYQPETVRIKIIEGLDPTFREALQEFLKATRLDTYSSVDILSPDFLPKKFTVSEFQEAQDGLLRYYGRDEMFKVDAVMPEQDDQRLFDSAMKSLEALKKGPKMRPEDRLMIDPMVCLNMFLSIETFNVDEQAQASFGYCREAARIAWPRRQEGSAIRKMMVMCARSGLENAGMFLFDLVRQERELVPLCKAREELKRFKQEDDPPIGMLFSALDMLLSLEASDVEADLKEAVELAVVLSNRVTGHRGDRISTLDAIAMTARLLHFEKVAQFFIKELKRQMQCNRDSARYDRPVGV